MYTNKRWNPEAPARRHVQVLPSKEAKSAAYSDEKRVEAQRGTKRRIEVTEVEEDAGILIINTDQIIAITAGQNATELQMADGHT
jgi:hypothetical protein